ncbi:hypothetical protein CCP3SC1_30014 [Gammaproteobacteria bacterium]
MLEEKGREVLAFPIMHINNGAGYLDSGPRYLERHHHHDPNLYGQLLHHDRGHGHKHGHFDQEYLDAGHNDSQYHHHHGHYRRDRVYRHGHDHGREPRG